ncbi:MAG: DUF167 domain-containing protein [Lautropia sp.]
MTLLDVQVGIGAKRSALAGRHDGVWRIRLAARPIDGQANAELLRFLARSLGLARSAVRLVAGASARRKRVEIDADAFDVDAALAALAARERGAVDTGAGDAGKGASGTGAGTAESRRAEEAAGG